MRELRRPAGDVEIDVKNGSYTQTPAYVGLAQCTSTCSSGRTNSTPTPGDFVDRASELGAVFNGTTTEERVNYYLTLPADSLAGGMRFLAAALRHPLFLPGELAREKEVVLGEYDRQEASPFFVLDQTMGQKLWPEQLEPEERHRRPHGRAERHARPDAGDRTALLYPE